VFSGLKSIGLPWESVDPRAVHVAVTVSPATFTAPGAIVAGRVVSVATVAEVSGVIGDIVVGTPSPAGGVVAGSAGGMPSAVVRTSPFRSVTRGAIATPITTRATATPSTLNTVGQRDDRPS
jgi:hypothetical protein